MQVRLIKGPDMLPSLIDEGIQLWSGYVEPGKYIPTEKEITNEIRKYLKVNGIFHWKQWGNPMMMSGLSDIIGILPDGRFLAIEVKRPRVRGSGSHHINRKQREFLLRVKESGGVAILAFCLDDVIKVLSPILERRVHG